VPPTQFEELYAFNEWANARLLETFSSLSHDQLLRDLGSSHRSLFATLRHIAGGEWRLAPHAASHRQPFDISPWAGCRRCGGRSPQRSRRPISWYTSTSSRNVRAPLRTLV